MTYSDIEIQEFSDLAQRLADAARGQTLSRFRARATVFNKAGPWYDPVTDADREAERVIVEMLSKIYPDHGVIGEEFGEKQGQGALRWIIDPVDGTRAFVCGVATWTTLISLEDNNQNLIGLIDQPYTGERWIGAGGKTKFIHGEKETVCRASGQTDLGKARISTTDPLESAYFTSEEAQAFARLNNASRLARYSMDAYAYGLLALGELDIVAETALQLHDYAALRPVVEGAGGVITNWRGDPVGSDDRGEVLAAATPELHASALAVLMD